MRKVLAILLFAYSFSFAGQNGKEIKFEAKLIDSIAAALFKDSHLNVYVYGEDAKKIIKYSSVLRKTDDLKKATFILASTKLNSELKNVKKPIIGMKYFLLKNENVIGAIFWHKGRPNIVFIKDRLKKFGINPPKSLEKYIEDKVW